jgi:hypothetical protein
MISQLWVRDQDVLSSQCWVCRPTIIGKLSKFPLLELTGRLLALPPLLLTRYTCPKDCVVLGQPGSRQVRGQGRAGLRVQPPRGAFGGIT